MEKRLKTHPSQWAIFLDFAEKNPQILTKKFDGVNGRKKYLELWEEITEVLNSMGYLNKSVDKWQKAVADWKSKVKPKAAELNRGVRQTGGGGPLPQLNENEMRLINILGRFVTGVQTNKELGL
uniref:Regulatory protein zeste n=1 Tax=Diabrotica virgifera virgifera TaxID=50390 RepID=A0A6P7GWX7_DIAVI